MGSPSAKLLRKIWCLRTFAVECGGQRYVVRYSAWGLNKESVSVDGVVVARRGGDTYRMTHGYRFRLGTSTAELIVAVPWWGELFPLYLSFVCLQIDGVTLYQNGRP